VTLSLREVNIEVNEWAIKFEVYDNNFEYEIDSDDLEKPVIVSACIKALRKYTQSCTTEKRRRVDLVIRLVDSEKYFWEQTVFGIFITDKGAHFDLQFMANAAVGMQHDDIWDIVSSHIQQTEFRLLKVRHNNDEFPLLEGDGWHGWGIDLRLRSKSFATFGELLEVRSRISQEIFLPSEKLTTPYLILRAIQAGRSEALIGKQESELLEVKSMAYDLRKGEESYWKLELAKDVAQFANAHDGGILLIGYRTASINGLDIIKRLTPVQPKSTRLQAYRDVLKSRIHPPISGLQIGSVPVSGNEIIYFYVPPQPEENKPYLISGATIDDCYDSTGISIVRRQGDASIPVTAQEIHAALVVGRALIRDRGHSI
jgi:hypothetical protein